jgi:uncharacterized protein YkwD
MIRVTNLTFRRFALLALIVLSVGSVAFLTACSNESLAEIKTYDGINKIRANHGLPPLKADAELVKVARIRSQDMAAKGYFSHNPPDGCNYTCLMTHHGIKFAYVGENIAWNTWDWSNSAQVTVDMWEASPGHLQNILTCQYTRMGTGVAQASNGRIYYTMVFEGNGRC